MTGLADFLIEQDQAGARFTDPQRLPVSDIGRISDADLDQVQQLLLGLVNNRALLASYFGQYISHAKHELDTSEPEPHYAADEIVEYLAEGCT